MNKKTLVRISKIAVSLIFLISSVIAYAEGNWHLIKDSKGIQVFNKDIEGTEIKEFKASAIIDAPIQVLFAVMIDVPAGTQWMDNCIEAKLIKTLDKDIRNKNVYRCNFLVYYAIAAPFPVSNRDFILFTEANWDLKKQTIAVNFHAVSDSGIPARNGHVRISELYGSYVFQAIDKTHTRTTYTVKQNPGGNLSASMVNYVNKNIPYNTIEGLRKTAADQKYIESSKNVKIMEFIKQGQ